MRGLSVRMSERICFLIREFRSSPHKLRVTMAPSLLFMRACDSGRHSVGYFSVAADRKVTRQRGETECLNHPENQKRTIHHTK